MMSRVVRFTWPWLLGLAIVVGALTLPSLAGASVSQEEQAGSQVLRELEGGKLRCAEASGSDFDHIGEYVMGRMFDSPQGHEAMNNMMSTMMGSRGEQGMHEAMGRRFAGCGGGRIPGGFGRMMGAVNAMGMMGGGMMGGGMMGGGMMGAAGPGFGAYGNGPGSMMGGWGDHDDSSAAAIVALGVVIGTAALALAWLVLGRRREDPLEVLNRRFADGELTTEEYRQRRAALS